MSSTSITPRPGYYSVTDIITKRWVGTVKATDIFNAVERASKKHGIAVEALAAEFKEPLEEAESYPYYEVWVIKDNKNVFAWRLGRTWYRNEADRWCRESEEDFNWDVEIRLINQDGQRILYMT